MEQNNSYKYTSKAKNMRIFKFNLFYLDRAYFLYFLDSTFCCCCMNLIIFFGNHQCLVDTQIKTFYQAKNYLETCFILL